MRKKAIAVMAIILLALLSGFHDVSAQPVPIGSTSQTNPFESNPAGSLASPPTLPGQTGNPLLTRDGYLNTFLGWRIGGSISPPVPYVELFNFDSPESFTIGWVDIKIKYSASATRDDRYRMIYRVGGSAWQDLQPWISGAEARFDHAYGQADERVWSKVVEPNDGVWDWTDIYNCRIRVETQRMVGIEDSIANRISVYEVWLTIYEGSYPGAGLGVSIQPSTIIDIFPGDFFFVDIFVADVVGMFGYEFRITYDTNVLTATDYFSYNPFSLESPSEINDDPWGNGTGYVHLSYATYLGDVTGFTGSQPLARIYFLVDMDGSSTLSFALSFCKLVDTLGATIPVTYWQNGFYSTWEFHDVAVIDVSANATQVMPGEIVEVNVTVANQGTFAETFTVTSFYDSTAVGPPEIVDLNLGATQNVTFNWNTAGTSVGHYSIKAEATLALDQDPLDNTLVDGIVIVGRHDIAVTSVVRAYPTINDGIAPSEILKVEKRQIVFINLTVMNMGTFTETFVANASYSGGGLEQPRVNGEYAIRTWSDVSLNPGMSTVLTVAWDTTTVIHGGTQNWVLCQMIGRVAAIPYEKGPAYDNTLNNFFEDGTVNVTRLTPLHDIAVTNVQTSQVKAAPGDTVTIMVTVENQGDMDETFTVTAYYDETAVSPQTLTLAVQGITTLSFAWNTAGVALGEYTIKANASIVPGEADISDNERVDGVITLAHRTLSIELSGSFDYAYRESIRMKVAALVKDASTMEPVSNAAVSIKIYNDVGALWISSTMVENPDGSGIYVWQSSGTIYSLQPAKGIYLAEVQASYKSGPVTRNMLLFHIDPPAEEASGSAYYAAFTIVALVGAAELILRRRQIFSRRQTKT